MPQDFFFCSSGISYLRDSNSRSKDQLWLCNNVNILCKGPSGLSSLVPRVLGRNLKASPWFKTSVIFAQWVGHAIRIHWCVKLLGFVPGKPYSRCTQLCHCISVYINLLLFFKGGKNNQEVLYFHKINFLLVVGLKNGYPQTGHSISVSYTEFFRESR